MAVSQANDLRKPSGGKKKRSRHKKIAELGNLPTNTVIGETKKQLKRTKGGNYKVKAKYINKANVFDPKTKKYQIVVLKTERENPANRNFARMNILTKGAVVDTEMGAIRITSRPGQHGVINAVLLEKK